jgi:hypothetical protein
MGKPYLLYPNGEGKNAEFDEAPLYRTDKFDCLTYVSTVIALAKSHDLAEFQQMMKEINYENGQVEFVHRNHFTSSDYNINNQKNGVLTDITKTITNQGKPIYKVITMTVDKPAWYRSLTPARLQQIETLSDKDEQALLKKLRANAKKVRTVSSSVPYIPMEQLFNQFGEANTAIFKQIPPGSVVEIVRSKWTAENDESVHLLISHLGFAIPTAQGMQFRQASSVFHKVMDIPLVNYLRHAQKEPDVKGIHIERVNSY